ncbi:hypothetical protein BDR22DRAFT_879308 [Usnea florida]
MAGDTAEELERFRQQWHQEVTQRVKGAPSAPTTISAQSPSKSIGEATLPPPLIRSGTRETEEHAGDPGGEGYHDLEDKDEERRLGEAGERIHPSITQEPRSALDHYELAVERESEGSLGDSLNHYRKAYKLDAAVDSIYKNKHFPPSTFKAKPINPNPSNAAVTVPNPAHHSLDGPPASTISELISSFSSIPVPGQEPPTDTSPQPPCPISIIPSELLINALLETAILDVASFARLSLVCKRLAYLVATEDRIWKRVCLGPEFGFSAMHYKWTCSISGGPLPLSIRDLDVNFESINLTATAPLPDPFALSRTYPNYRDMFKNRPRLRFNGCYISTVNYIRPGGNNASHFTWNTPVHIVTYYRYLRFFRDGRCASLLTTSEPADVVHHLTKENMHTRHAGGLPSAVMNHCLRGRWKLSGDPYRTTNDAGQANPKYIYKMALQLRRAGRSAGATRNNKLTWIGYWSYNKLADDWAEFGLKNDKAFLWSRVRSYGTGE